MIPRNYKAVAERFERMTDYYMLASARCSLAAKLCKYEFPDAQAIIRAGEEAAEFLKRAELEWPKADVPPAKPSIDSPVMLDLERGAE